MNTFCPLSLSLSLVYFKTLQSVFEKHSSDDAKLNMATFYYALKFAQTIICIITYVKEKCSAFSDTALYHRRIVLGEIGTNDVHEKPETQPTIDEQRINDGSHNIFFPE